jgi:hypothetical protein
MMTMIKGRLAHAKPSSDARVSAPNSAPHLQATLVTSASWVAALRLLRRQPRLLRGGPTHRRLGASIHRTPHCCEAGAAHAAAAMTRAFTAQLLLRLLLLLLLLR